MSRHSTQNGKLYSVTRAGVNLLLCQQSVPSPSHLVAGGGDAAGRHVGAANRLDLLHASELLVVQDLVKVDDYLVQEADALHTLAVGLLINFDIDTFNVKIEGLYLVDILGVELSEVGNASEQHPSVTAALGKQVLHPALGLQVELSHVEGEQVLNWE